MESDQVRTKEMKVDQIQSRSEVVVMSGTTATTTTGVEFPNVGQGQGGLMRQPSMTKTNCLCSPTTHTGSFRCRLHRTPSLQRTKSIEYSESEAESSTVVDADKDRMH